MQDVYELHADICKIFSNAKRLEILSLLRDGEVSANSLLSKTGLSKANLSQHMGLLRSKGVVVARRKGLNIYYRISNPKIIQACDLMREVLLEQLSDKGKLVKELQRTTSKK